MLKKIASNFELRRSADKLGPKTLLVLVINEDCTKAVLVNRDKKQGLIVEEALILPKLDLSSGESSISQFCSDYGLRGHYCSVVVQQSNEYTRVTDVSLGDLKTPVEVRKNLKELFGVDENHSLVYDVIDTNEKLSTTSILAVAMDLDLVEGLHHQVTDAKRRPVSLMLSSASIGMYLMTNFIKDDESHAFLYVGDLASTFMVFQKGKLTLIRQFDNGINNVLQSIQNEFGFDEGMAYDLFVNNSFDYSLCLNKVTSWFYQIGISLDYIERKSDLRIKTLNLIGFGVSADIFKEVLSKAVKRQVNGITPQELFADFISEDGFSGIDGVEDFIIGICESINIMSGGLK